MAAFSAGLKKSPFQRLADHVSGFDGYPLPPSCNGGHQQPCVNFSSLLWGSFVRAGRAATAVLLSRSENRRSPAVALCRKQRTSLQHIAATIAECDHQSCATTEESERWTLAQEMPPSHVNSLTSNSNLCHTLAPEKPTNRSHLFFLRTNLQKGSEHEQLFSFSVSPAAGAPYSQNIPGRYCKSAQDNPGAAGRTPVAHCEPIRL